MTLYTKSIYAPISSQNNLRICIMSRLTANDGKTPVKELIEGKLFDYWAKILAPSEKIVGAYYRGDINWQIFTEQYLNHIRKDKIKTQVHKIANSALNTNITLLCVEDDPTYCHRRLLAEECKKIESNLEIKIN